MRIFKVSQNLQFVKPIDGMDERQTIRALRDATVNEQLAVQQYEAIADGTADEKVKEVVQDIANEEKVHIGELQALLKSLDPDEEKSLSEGEREVKASKHDPILEALRGFIEDTKDDWNYVTPEELDEKGTGAFHVIDIRKPEDFAKGHIDGAKNVFWMDLLDDENLDDLPKDKPILLVCYVGHTSSQMVVALRLLGYDATSLKFGMGKSPVEGVPVAGWYDYGFEVKEGGVKKASAATLSMGDVVDVRSTGDGSIVAAPHSRLKNAFPIKLPRGIFRCTIVEVDNPDFYANNVVTYVGQTDDGMFIRFTSKATASKVDGPSSQSAIGAGKNRKMANEELPYVIDVICAWCNKKLGTQRSKHPGDSHGICQSCMDKVVEEYVA